MDFIKPEYAIDFFAFANDLLSYHKIKVFDFGSFHKECIDTVLKNRYVAVMLPVGHLKTTLFSICYPIWRLLREENYEMCLVSSTLDQSIKNLASVQYLIENTPWLKHLAPDDRSYSWSKSQLNTTNRNLLYVRPFSPSARGIQPNEIIYDDILREMDMPMDQIKDIFWHVFFPRGQIKGCKHTLVGTPMSQSDLFYEIKKKAEEHGDWKFFSYPAIVYGEHGIPEPLWKEGFTIEQLNEIKSNMGAYRFSREYMCNPLGEGANFFPIEMILDCTDDEFSFSSEVTGRCFMGCDFAMSNSPKSDWNVFTIVDQLNGDTERNIKYQGKTHRIKVKNPVLIRHMERWRGPTGHVTAIKNLYEKFRPEKIIVDSSSFGQRFAQELRDLGLPVSPQDFQHAARINLLSNLRRLMESENILLNPPKLIIPTSFNNFTYDKTKHLVSELSGFQETKTRIGTVTLESSTEHDDTVMSLALAVRDIGPARPIPMDIIKVIPLEDKTRLFKY